MADGEKKRVADTIAAREVAPLLSNPVQAPAANSARPGASCSTVLDTTKRTNKHRQVRAR